MKGKYDNLIPKYMVVLPILFTMVCIASFVAIFFPLKENLNETGVLVAKIVLGVFSGIGIAVSSWYTSLRLMFSYSTKLKLPERIIEFVAKSVTIPEGKILNVGCGCGALAIACAKRNPKAYVTGIKQFKKSDKQGVKNCKLNAMQNSIKNVSFKTGNLEELGFDDECFDAVTSSYVFSNMSGVKDRKSLIRESLRVLKKGGLFSIHDLMTPMNYGDMKAFAQELRDSGYERVELVDTTKGKPIKPVEARLMMLNGSCLLYGIK